MASQFIKFRNSKVCKSIDPAPEVLNSIELLEIALFEKGLIDETTETMLITSYHITYKKNGKEVLMIRPFKSDWNVKIFGVNWNIQMLFYLPVTFEFEMEKTGWRLNGMMDAKEEDIKQSFLKAFQTTPIEQLLVYPLSVIQSYYIKNPSLFRTVSLETLSEVVESFWEGDMSKIRQLNAGFINGTDNNQVSEFLNYWFKKSGITSNLKAEQLHERMKVNNEGIVSIISSLNAYMNNLFTNYRNSLTSLWFDKLGLKNKVSFHSKFEEIRETIVLTDIFLEEMKQIDLNPHQIQNLENNAGANEPKPLEVDKEKNTVFSEENVEMVYQKNTESINKKTINNSLKNVIIARKNSF